MIAAITVVLLLEGRLQVIGAEGVVAIALVTFIKNIRNISNARGAACYLLQKIIGHPSLPCFKRRTLFTE